LLDFTVLEKFRQVLFLTENISAAFVPAAVTHVSVSSLTFLTFQTFLTLHTFFVIMSILSFSFLSFCGHTSTFAAGESAVFARRTIFSSILRWGVARKIKIFQNFFTLSFTTAYELFQNLSGQFSRQFCAGTSNL
jgi:hypothetical protein